MLANDTDHDDPPTTGVGTLIIVASRPPAARDGGTGEDGVAIVRGDGVVLYGNRVLSAMVKTPLARVLGRSLHEFLAPDSVAAFTALVEQGRAARRPVDVTLMGADGSSMVVSLAVNAAPIERSEAVCLVPAT
jgi:PAS domain-containing protein